VNILVLRRLALVVGIPWMAASACGGRTDLDAASEDGGTGQGGASGGKTASGGVGNAPPRGNGGRVGVGGTSFGGHPTPGAGGFVPSGGVSFGGVAPGFGGFTSSGGQGDCSFPACNCGNCLDDCFCTQPMGPAATCFLECGMGGFNTGGLAGAGGGVVATGGAPTVCFDPSTNSKITCGPPDFPIPTCCSDRGACGVLLSVGAPPSPNLPAELPFVLGCQEEHQPGTLDRNCPELGSLVGTTQSGPPACCRPDGTCGIDFGPIGIGCLQTLKGGNPIPCATGIVDAGADVAVPHPADAATGR
jgi:hypothetical protein